MTIADTKHWNIFIGVVADEADSEKVDTSPIEKLINEVISLTSYGTSVKEIFSVMLTYESPLHPPYLKFDTTSKTIQIGLRLPYIITEKSTAADVLAIMQHTFLIGILQMKTLEGIEDFDFDGLYEDVKNVFFPTIEKPIE